jgi:lysozyme
MNRFRPLVIAVLAVAALVAVALVAGPRWTPARSSFPTQGIDVSAHQGVIQWSELKSQGVDFAYIKASEGGDFRDKRFAENWTGAARAGIARGAYHFFTLCRSGAEQAANFLATVPRDPAALPPAVDLEFLGNCQRSNRSPTQFRRELQTFLSLVETQTGKPVLLYLTEEFDEALGVSRAFNGPLWLRRIVLKPNFGGRPWTLWQASNFRRLKGINGRVDWNVARLTWPPQPHHSQP